MNNILKQALGALTLALLLASCKVTQPYERPAVRTQGLYRDVAATDTTSLADTPWDRLFPDTLLQRLIAEGIANNLDLKTAMTRIQAAEANLAQSKMAFFPSVTGNGATSVAKVPNVPSAATGFASRQYQLYVNSSWEADIWGKLRSTKRSYVAALLQSESYRRAVQTQLIANIANAYYSLLAYDAQLKITQQNVDIWIENVSTMKELKEAAVVTGAAVVQSEASRYAAEVTIPTLKQSIRETENALSVLLGRVPGPISRTTIEAQQVPDSLTTGVPAQLLSRRPDVQQAEYGLISAFELTNVAKTYFYPSLTLTANAGFSAVALGDLFKSASIFGNLAAGLAQPIFNKGLNTQRLKAAQATQEQSLIAFQSTLLTAGQEVSNALFAYQTAGDRAVLRTRQLAALEKSVEYTKELLKYSSANYTEVLVAQQSMLTAQLNSVGDRLQQLQSVVNLYRALGGGWK
ncbi:efflux transporter outer membrane subunit [Siphonobacter aquaeclarae]|uniref:Efflux transporter, outer membrane factor (OMF) lipoprotein, NodT family n=1 Tax=Siphonobacter aquaeclarae TaxID=563176 RepID=A0A1G9PNP3_9BACT|nr:efflux transporter outer membrane subunit [Siphonobacter aquaeclarae]SDL99685.1 efflux transporter, outer membrane factor (OMF) lipoprotein, NodT family [Siphonobacter aquaeclarae]